LKSELIEPIDFTLIKKIQNYLSFKFKPVKSDSAELFQKFSMDTKFAFTSQIF